MQLAYLRIRTLHRLRFPSCLPSARGSWALSWSNTSGGPINSDCAVLGHDAGDSPVEDDTVIVTWDGMLGGSETVMSTACH